MSWVSHPTRSSSWRQNQQPQASNPPSWSRQNWRRRSDSSESSCSSLTSSSPPSSCGPSPPSKSWDSDWRAQHVPRSPSSVSHARTAFEDLYPGTVMYLPRQEDVPKSSVFYKRMWKRDDSPWGHPVVILKKEVVSDMEMVQCQLITSFRDRETFARKSDASKENIALIENTDNIKAHQGLNGVYTRLMTLELWSDRFPKTSFVNFYDKAGPQGNTFWIEYGNIQPLLAGRNIVFDEESLKRIINKQVR
ncbi:hypothetical protein PSPO01_03250 [Paraphaeosphaeria sporulosa]